MLAWFRALNEIQHNYSYLNSYILRVFKSSLVCHLSIKGWFYNNYAIVYTIVPSNLHIKHEGTSQLTDLPEPFFKLKEKHLPLRKAKGKASLCHPFLHRCSLLRFCTSKAGIQTMKHRMTVPIITVHNYDTVIYMYLTLSSHEMTIARIPRMYVHVQIVDMRHSPRCLDSRLH